MIALWRNVSEKNLRGHYRFKFGYGVNTAMLNPHNERWPPIYDAEDLGNTIEKLIDTDEITKQFYTSSQRSGNAVYQGDIIRIAVNLPLINEHGKAVAEEEETIYWMVLGNSCDIARDLDDVEWSQIIPLHYLGNESSISQEEHSALKRYKYSRRFYVPSWSRSTDGDIYVADFLRPVSIHKTALLNVANVESRLDFYSWMLFHSCLVRFMARDDGRFD